MKLLLVPPDTRPPTMQFPVTLAKAAGLEVFTPPPEALNNLNQPGDFEALKDWLLGHVKKADVLILSLEQLCLGGLIPARRVNDSLHDVLEKLELLRKLKAQNSHLQILAGGVIVRVAHGNDPLEEKPYYGDYGNQLRAYSEAFDRFRRQESVENQHRLQHALASLPKDILDDWLATRKRNLEMQMRALELVKRNVLDHLCLTLDDTSTFGLASHDRRVLEAKTDLLQLWHKVDIYPGADEVPVTLLARVLQEKASKVYVRYSGVNGANAGMMFEDRPAGELVKAQLRAANCLQVDVLADADFILAVNTPAVTQSEDQPDFLNVDTAARHVPEFIDFMARCLQAAKPVSVADIAYPNGAERRLIHLLEELPLRKLAGFSAWNTAGNTLGSAIAMGVTWDYLRRQNLEPETNVLWLETLFNRFVDDYLYQARVREGVRQQLHSANAYDLGDERDEAERLLAKFIEPLALEFWQKHFASETFNLVWEKPTLAWPRLFTGVFPFQVKRD
jgi:Protein of unknown function (DUF4127)